MAVFFFSAAESGDDAPRGEAAFCGGVFTPMSLGIEGDDRDGEG